MKIYLVWYSNEWDEKCLHGAYDSEEKASRACRLVEETEETEVYYEEIEVK